MRIFGNWNNHKAYPYVLVTGPAATPISLTDVKTFLKLDLTDTSEDTILTMMIEAAVDYCEKYTKRDLITKTYTTYRECFKTNMEIRRSKLQSIVSISYYDNLDVLQTVSSSVYDFSNDTDFSSVVLKYNQSWPLEVSSRPHPVIIQFTAGYGSSSSSVPSMLRQALLQIVAALYTNRGDCTEAVGCSCAKLAPGSAMAIIEAYRINDISGHTTRTFI